MLWNDVRVTKLILWENPFSTFVLCLACVEAYQGNTVDSAEVPQFCFYIVFYTHGDDIRVMKLIGRFGFCIVFARFAGMLGCGSDLILRLYCGLHSLSRSQGNNNSRDLCSCLFVLGFTRPEAISGQQNHLICGSACCQLLCVFYMH